MKLILILFAVFVLLGGGGAGAYFYFTNTAEAAIDPDQEMAEKQQDTHKAPVVTELVKFDPVLVPVVDRDGVSQVVTLVVGLEIIHGANIDHVKMMSPKLKNAYIQDMYGVLNRHAAMKGGTLGVDLIKSRLSKISQRILGEDVVYEVKVEAVQQRPV